MKNVIHVLHLEDDPADKKAVQAALAEAGLDCRITALQTRDEFETTLQDGTVDIVLSEYRLRTFDSLSAIRVLREFHCDAPLIVVSSVMDGETVVNALTQGAADYVFKQHLMRLESVVKRVLQKTHHKRKQKELEDQIVLMNFAMDSIQEAVFLIDEDACFKIVNDRACRMSGYTRNELLTMRVPDVNSDLTMECWRDHWQYLKKSGTFSFESNMITKDDRIIPVEVSANFFEYNGQYYDLGLVRDITERKQIEGERLSNLKFFESMDQIHRAIQGARDLDSMLSETLDAVLTIFDCDRAYLSYPCDPDADTLVVPMERNKPEYPGAFVLNAAVSISPAISDVFRIMLSAGGPVKLGPNLDYPLPADLTEAFGVQCAMVTAFFPKADQSWQFGIQQCSHVRNWTAEEVTIFQEISRRLADGLTSWLMFQDLEQSEEQYRRIVDTANEGIWELDKEDVTDFVNERMARMLGYSMEEIIGRPSTDFMHEHELTDHDEKQESLRHGLAGTYERRFSCKDGQTLWALVSATPVYDDEHHFKGSFAMVTDITAKKLAEKDLKRHRIQLEELVKERTAELETANKELAAFAYSVAHDLRAPLRHINGFLELLKQKMGTTLDQRGRHYMETISDSTQKMGQLIDDLLFFSRMGRQAMSNNQVDLESLVHDIVRELKPDIDGRDIQWRIEALPKVTGDAAMLRIALANLISNGLKFTRSRQQARIEIGSLPPRDLESIVFVRDNGVGFEMDYAHNLFGVFQRLHRQDEFEGTGIGLATVRRIINRHSGQTWAEGELGRGATFFFSLPQTQQNDASKKQKGSSMGIA
jgi:PAS domain S-box-containing protein